MQSLADKRDKPEGSPMRRCIVCRNRSEKGALLRFSTLDGVLVFDLRQRIQARGFYVCAQAHCLSRAWRGKLCRVAEAKDCSMLDGEVSHYIVDSLLPALRKRYSEVLLVGYQTGELIYRSELVEQAAREDRLMCYVLATDAGAATRAKYERNAQRKRLICCGLLSKNVIGSVLGCSPRSVLGWLGGRGYRRFLHLESMISQLSAVKVGDL